MMIEEGVGGMLRVVVMVSVMRGHGERMSGWGECRTVFGD